MEKGNEVFVILKETGGPEDVIPEEFKSNKLFSYQAIHWAPTCKGSFISRYLDDIKYAIACGKTALKQGKFDSVFLQSNSITYFYMRFLTKLNCRIVYNVQDVFPYNLKLSGQLPFCSILFPILRKLQNLGYRLADKIITISDDMKQTLIDDGIEAEKIEVIYNWSYADTPIDIDTIDKASICNLNLNHSKFNVIYAGNIGKMQNVELIAKAAKSINNDSVFFYIIGEGSNKDNVGQMIAGLKNVSMLPLQPSIFAESIYAQADLNVIPLMPGGIKTALPSKTATILRVNKPVVFCIDPDSKFQSIFNGYPGVFFCNCNSPEFLTMQIEKIQSSCDEIIERKEIKLMKKTNAYKYISTMCGL